MPLVYTGAPGCSFKPTGRKSLLQQHLRRSTWCPCKDAGWTVELAVRGQTDGRKTRVTQHTDHGINIAGDHARANINNFNITVNVNSPVLPSGSDAEREYLYNHAESILKAVVAGVQGPSPDILSRFVNETWCSGTHTALNNVLSLKASNHEYIRLCMHGDSKAIETLAGKEAPRQLLDIARKILTQLARDTCGFNPVAYDPPCYDEAYATRAAAEEEHRRYGRGVVRRAKVRAAGAGRTNRRPWNTRHTRSHGQSAAFTTSRPTTGGWRPSYPPNCGRSRASGTSGRGSRLPSGSDSRPVAHDDAVPP